MATPIKNRGEFDELCNHLAEHGLHMPSDTQTVEELQRHLLTGLKTRAAVLAQQEAKRTKKNRGRNPDAPDDDEEDASRRSVLNGMQFGTAGDDSHTAAVARKIVDAQEHYTRSPNTVPNPFARG